MLCRNLKPRMFSDINTIVCGRCRRNQSCVSRDKINWRCKRKRSKFGLHSHTNYTVFVVFFKINVRVWNTIFYFSCGWEQKVEVRRISLVLHHLYYPCCPALSASSRKVHFFASYPVPLSGKVNRIKYTKVLVNVGRAFNSKTGSFRAPVKGIYQFFFSTQTTGVKTELWLVVNSYWVSVSLTRVGRSSSVGGLSTYMTFLRKGSVVYVTQNCGRSWANAASMTITFGGSLLVQMK